MIHVTLRFIFFFFNDTATTEIYTLSLHDALPILVRPLADGNSQTGIRSCVRTRSADQKRQRPGQTTYARSEEHTSELQSQSNLVCRLLLEKKKQIKNSNIY